MSECPEPGMLFSSLAQIAVCHGFELWPLAREREAVGDRHQAQINPLVSPQFLVESAYGDCIVLSILRVCDFARPKRIVDGNQPSGSDKLQTGFVVAAVIFL